MTAEPRPHLSSRMKMLVVFVLYFAAGVAFAVYLINFFLSFLLPEPKAGDFEE